MKILGKCLKNIPLLEHLELYLSDNSLGHKHILRPFGDDLKQIPCLKYLVIDLLGNDLKVSTD